MSCHVMVSVVSHGMIASMSYIEGRGGGEMLMEVRGGHSGVGAALT